MYACLHSFYKADAQRSISEATFMTRLNSVSRFYHVFYSSRELGRIHGKVVVVCKLLSLVM
jgi:hypothetical protein